MRQEPIQKIRASHVAESRYGDIEPVSYLWHELLCENHIPADGRLIEVAPGYEPKIGNALSLMGFHGSITLIEPDEAAARHVQRLYQRLMPDATVSVVTKTLQDAVAGTDVPFDADALLASHPFDDMVIAFAAGQASFFSRERDDGAGVSVFFRKFYGAVKDADYLRGIRHTVATWKDFVSRSRPVCFIASQYPSRMLAAKGLVRRQNSGFIVLEELKRQYKERLRAQMPREAFGYKGDPRWWIVAGKPHADPASRFLRKPFAIKRLGESLFVRQWAKRLSPGEYEVVYTDNAYFNRLGHDDIAGHANNFAIALDTENSLSSGTVLTYADRQKDKTDIGLSGNTGSGRAVYYGDRFNILGVGRTTLCKSTVPSHNSGRAELLGAARRLIMSHWINYFTQRAVTHPVLIALKETAKYKWNANPIPLALLVRADDGSLDRPSHVEYDPQIPVDFQKTLIEYARLDAEYFAYRILFGAWSTGNYSLGGQMIDLESASFVKYRGPYHTASAKYQDNFFGYEGLGFLKILRQLADIKGMRNMNIRKRFYLERRKHLGRCFLTLLGVADDLASDFFSKHQACVIALSGQFEKLAKKIGPKSVSPNLYMPLPDDQDPSLLDMSNLFRNLANIYGSSSRNAEAMDFLIRRKILRQIRSGTKDADEHIKSGCADPAQVFLYKQAVITADGVHVFMLDTEDFIRDIFRLLDLLHKEGCLGTSSPWHARLQAMNQDLPAMYKLNGTLRCWIEAYRLKRIGADILGRRIDAYCKMPQGVQGAVQC